MTFSIAPADFWSADRLVTRRLRALAALDPDVGAVITARDNRNYRGLAFLIGRVAARPDLTMSVPSEDAARVLHTLTSFETHPTKSHGFDCFLIGRDP